VAERELYVSARRVLLDGLEALRPHLAAVTLVGAQAIYLRVGEAEIAVAPSTTDGDLALDPGALRQTPPLQDLMRAAGFERKPGVGGKPLVGLWARAGTGQADADVSVDLLMPQHVAPPAGRRAARLAGHEKGAVLKVPGLEACLVDADVMRLEALEPGDARAFNLRVAGPAALLVAKMHKIADRTQQRDRTRDKDALDIFRLLRGTSSAEFDRRLAVLLRDARSAPPTRHALGLFRSLFGSADGAGVAMAVRATENLMPAVEVIASLTAIAGESVFVRR